MLYNIADIRLSSYFCRSQQFVQRWAFFEIPIPLGVFFEVRLEVMIAPTYFKLDIYF